MKKTFLSNKEVILISLLFTGVACSPKKKHIGAEPKARDSPPSAQRHAGLSANAFREFTLALPIRLGEKLPPAKLDRLRELTIIVPELQDRALPSMRNLLTKGDPSAEIASVSIRMDGDCLISTDFTLRSAHEGTERQKQYLLSDYKQAGKRSVSLLNNNLEAFEVQITDYQHTARKDLHACAFDAGEIMRIVLFDSRKISSDVLIPTTKSLPPGLLQKALHSLEAEKARRENREGPK